MPSPETLFTETVKLHDVAKPVADPDWAHELVAAGEAQLQGAVSMHEPGHMQARLLTGHEVNKIFYLRPKAASFLAGALSTLREEYPINDSPINTDKATVVRPGKIVVNLVDDEDFNRERRAVVAAMKRITGIDLGDHAIRGCVEIGRLHDTEKRVDAIHLFNDIMPQNVQLGQTVAKVSYKNGVSITV